MDPNKYTSTKFDKEAIDAVYKGVREVTSAVATTLGPLGRNVLIDKGFETSVIHDGVKVSLVINPKDPFERNGANIIKEATKKQRDEVGDGTTAVAVLSQAILDETLKATASGINPMLLRKGLESGAKKITDELVKLSSPVKTKTQKTQIATISAQDAELGKMIADTIDKIGDDGVFSVEESKAAETYVEMQEGMQFDKGYAHQFMITDPERMLAILEDVPVLVTDYSLNSVAEIGKFLENTVLPNTKKCFFIAPEIGVDFLQVLLGAKMQGQFLGIAMRAPGLGTMQTEILQDICALTGATLITKEAGMKFEDQPYEVLGKAGRIVSSKISTIITNGAGHRDDVLQRIQSIKTQLEEDGISDYDIEQLKARMAKLTNGVAVIKIGGQTEIEMKERKERADDSVRATQSACKSGLVPGGEVSYLSCLHVLDENILGERILRDALRAPFKRLVENAGYDSGEKLNELLRQPINSGFDVTDGKIKDMVKAGIIDPASVPITAVTTAVSVAVQLSSLGAAIVLENVEEKK